jgi:hypothetical protein
MGITYLEKELAESGWVCKPKDDTPVSIEKLLVKIEETARNVDANLKRKIERKSKTVAKALTGPERASPSSLSSLLSWSCWAE